jgi:hypothetical protein
MHSASPRDRFRPSWPKLALVAFSAGFLFLVAAPLAMADCPVTDPGCVSKNVSDVNLSPAPSLPPLDDAKDKADGVVKQGKNAVGGVSDAVDGLLHPGGGGDGGGGDDGGAPPGGGPGGQGAPGSGGASQGLSGSPGSLRFRDGPLPPGNLSPSSPASSTSGPTEPPDLLGRIGGIAAEAARHLGFPLVLALVVVAFLMMQNYLDRKDPKLALAPILPEVMRFE